MILTVKKILIQKYLMKHQMNIKLKMKKLMNATMILHWILYSLDFYKNYRFTKIHPIKKLHIIYHKL